MLPDAIKKYHERIIISENGCWVWQGYKQKSGYSIINPGSDNNVRKLGHRHIYEILVGPIPPGLTLDHLCRNPPCVNPEHLDPCTLIENINRAIPYRAKTHCPRGHEYTASNTMFNMKGSKACRKCKNDKQKAKRRALRLK